jgi:transposase-like protein
LGLGDERVWQSRPVDPVYPICYIDAIRIKIRDGGVVANKAAHIVIGVDIEGIQQVLGIWIQQTKGAKFWHGVLTELRNRGCRDALFVCCDGLSGLPESIAAVWPAAVVQTCVVHLLRSCMRYASYTDRRTMAQALRPIYTAATEEAAKLAIEEFRPQWKTKSPGAVAVWDRAWAEFVPFLAFPVEIRKVLHHQRDRVAELPAAQGHQGTRIVPVGCRGDETALPGHPQHQPETRINTRTRNLPLDRSTEHLRHPIPRPTPAMTQR